MFSRSFKFLGSIQINMRCFRVVLISCSIHILFLWNFSRASSKRRNDITSELAHARSPCVPYLLTQITAIPYEDPAPTQPSLAVFGYVFAQSSEDSSSPDFTLFLLDIGDRQIDLNIFAPCYHLATPFQAYSPYGAPPAPTIFHIHITRTMQTNLATTSFVC